MKVALKQTVALVGGLLFLVACSQVPEVSQPTLTQSVQAAVGTGIAMTRTADSVLNNAVASAISKTQTAQPPSPTEIPPSLTPSLIPATPTAKPSRTPTPSPELPTATDTRVPPSKTPHAPVPVSPLPTTAPPAQIVLDEYHTIQTLAGLNDAHAVDCQQFVDTYNHLSGLPATYDGISEYAQARAHVLESSRDENLFCTAALIGANTDNTIPFLQWGASRQGTDQAVQLLRPVIIALGFTP